MTGRLLSHYRLLAEIGRGGMGVVYLAEDTTLGRKVALKLLPRDLTSDPGRLARFAREARVASSINHPYVCTVYEVGEAEGEHYIATELVDGGSLRTHLSAGSLDAPRLLRFAIQIAEGLSKAHQAGIVHRDIKPENILISKDGFAKIADFGLAKLFAAVDDGQATATALNTLPGTVIGTARYMSPEQARGLAADHRSDIFSLGLVLYEMAAGRPAYDQPTALGAIHAILTDPLPAEALAACPAPLVSVIRRATEKDPAQRYQSAEDLATDLRRMQSPTPVSQAGAHGHPRGRRRLIAVLLCAGVPVFVGLSWALMTFLQPRRPDAVRTASGPTRIAVLPFENLRRAPEDDWLSGAFLDSITFDLGPVESLVLIPRESIVDLLQQHGVREGSPIGGAVIDGLTRVLRARYYVDGTYQRVGDDIRVVARLVDVESGAVRTQERVTDRAANLMALQDEIAHRVAANLQFAAPLERRGTSSLIAYRAFTEGRGFYGAGQFQEALDKAEEAVRLDSGYAEAWALLAKTRARAGSPSVAVGAGSSSLAQDALKAARRAVDLAPDLYDGYIGLALAYRGLGNVEMWRAAAVEAARRNPRMGEGYALLGDSYNATLNWGCGRDRDPERAEEAYRKALDIDPGALVAWGNRGFNLYASGQPERALALLDEGRRLYPVGRPILRQSGTIRIFLGQLDEGERLLRATAPGRPSVSDRLFLAGARLRQGDRTARAELEEAARLGGRYDDEFVAALLLLLAGDDRAGAAHLAEVLRREPSCGAFLVTTRLPAAVAVRDRPAVRALLETQHTVDK